MEDDSNFDRRWGNSAHGAHGRSDPWNSKVRHRRSRPLPLPEVGRACGANCRSRCGRTAKCGRPAVSDRRPKDFRWGTSRRPASPSCAGSRYTPSVSWKRPVSVVVLAILTALPASGVVCAMLCESATSSTASVSGHHHGSTNSAEEPARPATSVRIQSVSDHDCSGHGAALRQASTTAAERTGWSVTSIPFATTVPATFRALTESGPPFEYSTLPDISPPTTTPLVLRV